MGPDQPRQVPLQCQLLELCNSLAFDLIERVRRIDTQLGASPADIDTAQDPCNGRLRGLDLMVALRCCLGLACFQLWALVSNNGRSAGDWASARRRAARKISVAFHCGIQYTCS